MARGDSWDSGDFPDGTADPSHDPGSSEAPSGGDYNPKTDRYTGQDRWAGAPGGRHVSPDPNNREFQAQMAALKARHAREKADRDARRSRKADPLAEEDEGNFFQRLDAGLTSKVPGFIQSRIPAFLNPHGAIRQMEAKIDKAAHALTRPDLQAKTAERHAAERGFVQNKDGSYSIAPAKEGQVGYVDAGGRTLVGKIGEKGLWAPPQASGQPSEIVSYVGDVPVLAVDHTPGANMLNWTGDGFVEVPSPNEVAPAKAAAPGETKPEPEKKPPKRELGQPAALWPEGEEPQWYLDLMRRIEASNRVAGIA